MKYYDDREMVHMLITDKQPFKGVKNYFKDAMLYIDTTEASTSSTIGVGEDYDSGNEADVKLEPINEEDFESKINPLLINSYIYDVTEPLMKRVSGLSMKA